MNNVHDIAEKTKGVEKRNNRKNLFPKLTAQRPTMINAHQMALWPVLVKILLFRNFPHNH